MRLLFVCTGNRCRSPLAERLAARWAAEALGSLADAVTTESAGTDATAGEPMEERSALALAELGGDPRGVATRILNPSDIEGADLVLTMTRTHRRRVLELAPRAMRRTFTLTEAAALLSIVDPAALAAAPVAERGRALATLLSRARAFRAGGPEDDIPDPIGRPLEEHRDVAARIARDLQPLTGVLFTPAADPLRTATRPSVAD